MDESVGKFCSSLAAFCNHLQSSCDALKQSVDRRPIPLDSASTSFMQCLNRKVSSTSGDLNLLESMTLDTVSFEELLGHCTEVYNKNQIDIHVLQDRLVSTSSYVPSADTDDGEKELDDFSPDVGTSALSVNKLEDDLLLDDSLSLKNFGLSDACLATIASEADDDIENEAAYQSGANIFTEIKGEAEDDKRLFEDPKSLINLSKDDYENLPKHMKNLVSWELKSVICRVSLYEAKTILVFFISILQYDFHKPYVIQGIDEVPDFQHALKGNLGTCLIICINIVHLHSLRRMHFLVQDLVAAVEKINSYLLTRSSKLDTFHQDEIISLGLGYKARSYLLLLIRMKQIIVETVDGVILYRILSMQ